MHNTNPLGLPEVPHNGTLEEVTKYHNTVTAEQETENRLLDGLQQGWLQMGAYEILGKIPLCMYRADQQDYAYALKQFRTNPEQKQELVKGMEYQRQLREQNAKNRK